MKIWHVFIEPVENRYPQLWARWFSEEIESRNGFYEELDGRSKHGFIRGDTQFRTNIKNGSFLDVTSTVAYKASQLIKIAKYIDQGKIVEGDMLFFHDLWFPLEMLYYLIDGLKIDLKVRGILHAGTYDVNDFTYKRGMSSWGADIEKAWFRRVEQVYVCSNYHAKLLQTEREIPMWKTVYVDFPYKWKELDRYRNDEKDIEVVFPHRLDAEKCPELIAKLREKGVEVFVTANKGLSREEYLRVLGRAKYAVSWSYQETFGIAMAEAFRLGAIPLVPNRLSYPELFPEVCLFDSQEGLVGAVTSGYSPRFDTCLGTGKSLHPCFRDKEDPFRHLSHLLESPCY